MGNIVNSVIIIYIHIRLMGIFPYMLSDNNLKPLFFQLVFGNVEEGKTSPEAKIVRIHTVISFSFSTFILFI